MEKVEGDVREIISIVKAINLPSEPKSGSVKNGWILSRYGKMMRGEEHFEKEERLARAWPTYCQPSLPSTPSLPQTPPPQQ